MAARSRSIPVSFLCSAMTPARSLPSSWVDSITCREITVDIHWVVNSCLDNLHFSHDALRDTNRNLRLGNVIPYFFHSKYHDSLMIKLSVSVKLSLVASRSLRSHFDF